MSIFILLLSTLTQQSNFLHENLEVTKYTVIETGIG